MKEEGELRERERILFSIMQYMPLCCDEQNATNHCDELYDHLKKNILRYVCVYSTIWLTRTTRSRHKTKSYY